MHFAKLETLTDKSNFKKRSFGEKMNIFSASLLHLLCRF